MLADARPASRAHVPILNALLADGLISFDSDRTAEPTFIPYDSALDRVNGQSQFSHTIPVNASGFHDEVPPEIVEPLLLRLGYPPLPLVASISGPTTLAAGTTGTWSTHPGQPSGGVAPYGLRWAYRLTCPAPPPPPTCSGKLCWATEEAPTAPQGPVDPNECGVWYDGGNDLWFSRDGSYSYPSMTVRLTVTDAQPQPATIQRYLSVSFNSGARPAGGDSAAVARGADVAEPSRGVSGVPAAYALQAVAPNPSSGRAAVRFDLPAASDVSLTVVDVLGREVSRLVDGRLEAGSHAAAFDGSLLPVGVYVVRLRAGAFAATRTLTLAR